MIEDRIRAVALEIDYPPTPDMTSAVTARLRHEPAPVPLSRRSRLRPALAVAAAILVVLVATLGFSPSARRAVAGWLGVDGIRITFDEGVGDVPTVDDPQLGDRVSEETAAAGVAFEILVPAELGPPDGYYLNRDVEGGEVSLVWAPGPGLPESEQTGFGAVLTQFVGDTAPEFIKKTAVSGTSVAFVTVGGGEAYLLEGAPHVLVRESDGDERILEPRLAGNTLLWDGGDVTYRLEAEVGLDRALEIAESLD